MLNGFFTIWLLLTVLSVTGCASKPQSVIVSEKQPTKPLQRSCDTTAKQIRNDYPWSVIGHHSTLVARYHSLGIFQAPDTQHQFTLCSDCPCPTSKQPISAHTTSNTTKTANRITKITVHFENASSSLSDNAQKFLARFFKTLSQDSQLTITGFTDDSAPGGTITNEALALNRATTISDFLVSLGLQENQVTVKASPLCCYIASNDTDSGRALNRRVEIHTTSLSTSR